VSAEPSAISVPAVPRKLACRLCPGTRSAWCCVGRSGRQASRPTTGPDISDPDRGDYHPDRHRRELPLLGQIQHQERPGHATGSTYEVGCRERTDQARSRRPRRLYRQRDRCPCAVRCHVADARSALAFAKAIFPDRINRYRLWSLLRHGSAVALRAIAFDDRFDRKSSFFSMRRRG
jgi:hypothetical protein